MSWLNPLKTLPISYTKELFLDFAKAFWIIVNHLSFPSILIPHSSAGCSILQGHVWSSIVVKDLIARQDRRIFALEWAHDFPSHEFPRWAAPFSDYHLSILSMWHVQYALPMVSEMCRVLISKLGGKRVDHPLRESRGLSCYTFED